MATAIGIEVRKEIKISAAHFIPGHPECGRMHGHNYLVELFAEGTVADLNEHGILLDFGDMKSHLQKVVGKHDHGDVLNDYPDWYMGLPPTAEVLAVTWLFELLSLDEIYTRLRVWETDTAYAEATIR